MIRRVFFSFHYDRDIWRANRVRNSWVTKDREDAGFWDASLWEEAKTKGDKALMKLIDEALRNTSVTAVLIGTETYEREWVEYEIKKSFEKGNGLLGVYIHKLKNENKKTDKKGKNPFTKLKRKSDGKNLSEIYPTYDWVSDDGYTNFGNWVEKEAKRAGK